MEKVKSFEGYFQLDDWFKEPVLCVFYLYLLFNFFFALFEISQNTLLGQYYLYMNFRGYLFKFILRSHWFKWSLIIISMLLILESFFKEKLYYFLPHKWKVNILVNWFKWVIPFLFVIQIYFTLKVYGSIYNHHVPLWKWEKGFWILVHPIFSSLPTWLYRFLDIVYVPGWAFAHWLFLLGLISSNETFKKRLFGVYGLSLMLGSILHYLFPAISPIYVDKNYFNYLPSGLISWHYHNYCLEQQTLFLKEGIEAFNLLKGKAIIPIAAFPSFHVGYALQIFLLARDFCKKWVVIISFLFLWLIIIGSLILGYHYLIDDIAGALIVYLMYSLVKN
ncbi:MAG: phosphatase PAP2 family protein [Candidatus Desulfofervidus auxilii]|nr:phosphatase PAP2 family protein [Candidatus Desulfofervidus auxilii]